MQFKTLSALSILAVATVSGAVPGPNAERMARGLAPLPPKRMFTPSAVQAAKRGSASGSPNPCAPGTTGQCCASIGNSGDSVISLLLGLLGIVVDVNVEIGATCTSLGATCAQTACCCSDTSHNGVVSIGCTPL